MTKCYDELVTGCVSQITHILKVQLIGALHDSIYLASSQGHLLVIPWWEHEIPQQGYKLYRTWKVLLTFR